MQIGRPHDPILHVPAANVDSLGNPVRVQDYELDRQTLESALGNVARYLTQKGQNLTIVAIGGVVNIMFLGSRQNTHDVDFLGTNLNNEQRRHLSDAAKYAERQSPRPLGQEWLNNEMILWLPPLVHRSLTDAALAQNTVIFQQPGLKIVAGPWSYMLVAKLNRLSMDTRRGYDLSDAVSYLREHVTLVSGGRPITRQSIEKMTADAGLSKGSVLVLRSVNDAYKQKYRSTGISGV